jgi:hypothetical protein
MMPQSLWRVEGSKSAYRPGEMVGKKTDQVVSARRPRRVLGGYTLKVIFKEVRIIEQDAAQNFERQRTVAHSDLLSEENLTLPPEPRLRGMRKWWKTPVVCSHFPLAKH